ncbi:conserved hypothetical protein [Talaromyces stipitatus ATCC 10500]|uniref:Zn(2)-C6 fungal-type domain-containing protein n=1 Tax=Talaromyces stipitatus (strain ATCC 10500 / CBS 375.48 / QM 6759 / NRRL 1006) TaxID=441959 RepID=B8M0M4_TALSN|nr:uncharacterized protein TSTA_086380 [Talaromyces stipitatus ATCC 10500]EED21407.1 conserved hypothetical protein [Talaromyces stipitatus ATCC 10500]
MNASVQRKRLACAECTRRKIKCDKVLPCRNCTRRGSSCYRNEQSSSHRRGNPRLPRITDSETADPSKLADNLTACIRELQETLRAVRTASSPNDSTERTVSLSVESPEAATLATHAPSERGLLSPEESLLTNTLPSPGSAEAGDAATILEFLAWGRRKVSTYAEDFVGHDLGGRSAQFSGDVALDQDPATNLEISPLHIIDESSLSLIQLLLPEQQSIVPIVEYHCNCLLWYHGSFHGLVFQSEFDSFLYKHRGLIDQPGIDLQWVGLLFAVLAGSMACAPRLTARSWGFEDSERAVIAQRWFKAALVCLNRANYTANHSVYAVQCIATMTISAHVLGHSNSHSVMLATAIRISQSLGFHRLGNVKQDHPSNTITRETGRRVWTQLCVQDWFSIPFSESYYIRQLDFNTEKPCNCMEEDMVPLSDDVPTTMSYHRFLYDIALLMPRLHDDLSRSNTTYTKYEHVLRYDTQMRTLVSKCVPSCLKSAALEPSWPQYVPWARHCLTITSAHKIIMIHRKFLWQSFTNPAFEFTRKTCIAASKTIIRVQKQVAKDNGPDLWIYHAFSVAASIILCLDLRFRAPSDSEYGEHRKLVYDIIEILSQSETSMIAKRGVKILKLLLQLEQENRRSGRSNPHEGKTNYARPTTNRPNDNYREDRDNNGGNGSGDGLPLDIHRLVVQAFHDQDCSQPSDTRSGNLHYRPREGEHISGPMQYSSNPSTFQGRWFWSDPADDGDVDKDRDHIGGTSVPQSGFVMNGSLEDILFLAQNGGPS